MLTYSSNLVSQSFCLQALHLTLLDLIRVRSYVYGDEQMSAIWPPRSQDVGFGDLSPRTNRELGNLRAPNSHRSSVSPTDDDIVDTPQLSDFGLKSWLPENCV